MKALQVILGTFLALFIGAVLFWPPYSSGGPSIETACISNLKQVAIGHVMYASDYDERLPKGSAWMDQLVPYIKNESLYHCPAFKEEGNPQAYGYSFNVALSMAKLPSKRADQIPLVFESSDLARNASGSTDKLPRPGRHKTSSGRSNNMAFADGHAKAIKDP